MRESLNIDTTKEKIYFVDDTNFGFPWEVQDQTQGLTDLLATGQLTDIKIIGHSEGGAAIVTVLDQLANDDSFLAETNVRDELKAAIMLETPTVPLIGWNPSRYNNLPQELVDVGMDVQLLDVWNEASPAHMIGTMPGWGAGNTYSHDTRNPWLDLFGGLLGLFSRFGGYHNDPLTNQGVIGEIKKTINN
jgi:hypothetical protein